MIAWVKIVASIPDYLFSFPLLWNTSYSEYGGGASGFFGDITDMLLLIFLVAYYLSYIIHDQLINKKNSTKAYFYMLIIVFISLLTQKRSIILAIGIMFFVTFLISNVNKKTFLTLLGSFIFMIGFSAYFSNYLPQSIVGVIDRVTGQDKKVVMSNEGRYLDIVDGINLVKDNPVMGTGPGSRILLSRTHLLSADTNPNSLMIHQAVLHTWMKYGLIGVIAYCCLFLWTFIISNKLRNRNNIIGTVMLLTLVGFFIVEQFTAAFFQPFRKEFFLFFIVVLISITNNEYWKKKKSICTK